MKSYSLIWWRRGVRNTRSYEREISFLLVTQKTLKHLYFIFTFILSLWCLPNFVFLFWNCNPCSQILLILFWIAHRSLVLKVQRLSIHSRSQFLNPFPLEQVSGELFSILCATLFSLLEQFFVVAKSTLMVKWFLYPWVLIHGEILEVQMT